MKTKVVIDTNVFISGIFFAGPPSRILKAWADNQIQIAVSEGIIEEYKRIVDELAGKFKQINIDPILELLLIEAELVPSHYFKEPVCEDPDDDKFLECTVASHAGFIISGDKHLLNLREYQGIKIMKATDFLQFF